MASTTASTTATRPSTCRAWSSPTTTRASTRSQTTTIPSSYYNTTKVTEYMPHADGNYSQPATVRRSEADALRRAEQDAHECHGRRPTRMSCSRTAPSTASSTWTAAHRATQTTSGSTTARSTDPSSPSPSTDTSSGWWQRNQLYFTGTATFQNQTTVPATILAPNFNVDIGNTDPTRSDNNVLTGAIIGGIVDVRGNAQIYGTIISMFDTSSYPAAMSATSEPRLATAARRPPIPAMSAPSPSRRTRARCCPAASPVPSSSSLIHRRMQSAHDLSQKESSHAERINQ